MLTPDQAREAWAARIAGAAWTQLAEKYESSVSAIKNACLQQAENEQTTTLTQLIENHARLTRLLQTQYKEARRGDPAAAQTTRLILQDLESTTRKITLEKAKHPPT